MRSELEQAVHDYLTAPKPRRWAALREQIKPSLIERLTIISVDPRAIASAIENALRLFVKDASPMEDANWLAWITAHAFSLLIASQAEVSWVDRVAARIPADSALERRAAVFRIILTLDGTCQCLLLTAARRPTTDERSADCRSQLNEIVASLV